MSFAIVVDCKRS